MRVEREGLGSISITILPMALRTLAMVCLCISSLGVLLLVALILRVDYASTPAALVRAPALAVRWAVTWAALTALHAATTFVVTLAIGRTTTFVLVCGDTLSVRRQRWYWTSRREWPVYVVRGTRITLMNRLALVDADGKVLCKLSVPDTVDLPWLSQLVRDAVAYGQGVPEPGVSHGTAVGID